MSDGEADGQQAGRPLPGRRVPAEPRGRRSPGLAGRAGRRRAAGARRARRRGARRRRRRRAAAARDRARSRERRRLAPPGRGARGRRRAWSEAGDAFRRAVELDPEDQVALSHLGHTAAAAGREEEARGSTSARRREHARRFHARRSAWSTCTARSASTTRRWHRRRASPRPSPTTCWPRSTSPSSASRSASSTRPVAAFERLRELDDVPGHEAYPLHGMIQAEIQRDELAAAPALAR